MLLYKSKLEKTKWTFSEISTKKYTHTLHLYPARMHPEIAHQLIQKYSKNKTDVIFDPFMGSGGVLLESMLCGKNSIGIDINPFAVLLSKVKTTPIKQNLDSTLNKIILNCSKDYHNQKHHWECLPNKLDFLIVKEKHILKKSFISF